MKTNASIQRSRKAAPGRAGKVSTKTSGSGKAARKRHALIALGVDTHAQQYSFARKIEHLGIEPTQKLSPEQFLEFLKKQLLLAERVVMVYEAGPYGFALYRQAKELGVECLVCAPEKLSRGRKRSNDKLDARELSSRLDRHLGGNDAALRLVRPPSLEQELRRRQSRERDTYRKERQRWIGRGRSLLHSLGVMRPGKWWEPLRRQELLEQIQQRHGQRVQEQVRAELDRDLEMLQAMTKQLAELTALICQKPQPAEPAAQTPAASKAVPVSAIPAGRRLKGIGVLSGELLDREMVDWSRFGNRRQVGSYTGLCPGEASSGESEMHLSIDKHGNPRVRALLVELAWLLPRYQPNYKRLQRWKWMFEKDARAPRALRKKVVTALARMLAVDLWRLKTGRCTPEELGLELAG